MRHIRLVIIRQNPVGLQLLVAQATIHLAQLRLPAPKVVHHTMMRVYIRSRPAAGGPVPLRMIGTILLRETELQKSVVMCLGRLLMTGLGLHRLPGFLPNRMVVEVTTLEAVVTPGTIGRTTTICLHLRAVTKPADYNDIAKKFVPKFS